MELGLNFCFTQSGTPAKHSRSLRGRALVSFSLHLSNLGNSFSLFPTVLLAKFTNTIALTYGLLLAPLTSSLAHLCLHLSVAKKAFFRPNFSSRGQIAMGGRPRDCATGQTYFGANSSNLATVQLLVQTIRKILPDLRKKRTNCSGKNFRGKNTFSLRDGNGTGRRRRNTTNTHARTNTKREPESGVTPENRDQLIFRD